MRFCIYVLFETLTEGVDLSLRQRGGLTVKCNQIDDARNLQNAESILPRDPYENVTGEERQFYEFSTIFPPTPAAIKWQKCLHLPLLELFGDGLFMSSYGVDGTPQLLWCLRSANERGIGDRWDAQGFLSL
jgi:hypothetical protein